MQTLPVIGLIAALGACQTERVEYHRRPAYYEQVSATPLQDEIVLDDGTVVRYRRVQQPGLPSGEGGKAFSIREEQEDGSLILRSILPEHVLMHALHCVREQEYQLMWDQLLSERTKIEFENAGEGFEEFAAHMQRNRHQLSAALNRMVAGLPSQEVSFTPLGNGVTRCRLRPQVATPFKFKYVDVVCDKQTNVEEAIKHGGLLINGWKLLAIR